MTGTNYGVGLIAAERARQVDVEGWSVSHDAGHAGESLAIAACCYALPSTMRRYRSESIAGSFETSAVPTLWPWQADSWKPSHDRIRDLVKAGALIAAEIDRLQAASLRSEG